MLSQLLQRRLRILSAQARIVTRLAFKSHRNHSTIVINATNTSPEDIIAECAKVRESMQNMNDVCGFERLLFVVSV